MWVIEESAYDVTFMKPIRCKEMAADSMYWDSVKGSKFLISWRNTIKIITKYTLLPSEFAGYNQSSVSHNPLYSTVQFLFRLKVMNALVCLRVKRGSAEPSGRRTCEWLKPTTRRQLWVCTPTSWGWTTWATWWVWGSPAHFLFALSHVGCHSGRVPT